MSRILIGKNTLVITLIVDEATHLKFDAFNFGANYLRSIAGVPGISMANDLPPGFINPLVMTYKNNFQSNYVIQAEIWFHLDRVVDTAVFDQCFITAWNTTIASSDNSDEFIYPQTENIDIAINTIESGSQVVMANAQASLPWVTSWPGWLVNWYHFYRAQVEVQSYEGTPIPVIGFSHLDNLLVSNVIKSNSNSLIGASVNPVNITGTLANGARAAISSARELANQVSADPNVQAAVNSVRQMIPDNILPISPSEWQLAKNVVVYGGIILGGVLLINGINRGTGK